MDTTPNCRDCGAIEAETGAEPVCFGSHLRGRAARQGLCPVEHDSAAYLAGRNAARARMRRERRERLWGRG